MGHNIAGRVPDSNTGIQVQLGGNVDGNNGGRGNDKRPAVHFIGHEFGRFNRIGRQRFLIYRDRFAAVAAGGYRWGRTAGCSGAARCWRWRYIGAAGGGGDSRRVGSGGDGRRWRGRCGGAWSRITTGRR